MAEERTDKQSPLDEQRFLSQNCLTGAVMPNQWTLRQLCRILCPPTTTTTNPKQETHVPKPVSADSQLLAIERDGRGYSLAGWQTAKTVPILKEAVALWYYEFASFDSVETKTEGPVSCRCVANLLKENKLPQKKETRVYSEVTGSWESISNIPNLVLALEAFQTSPPLDNSFLEHQVHEAAFPNDSEVATITEESTETRTIATTKDEIQDELERFLAHTDQLGTSNQSRKSARNDQDDLEEASYESDGGTRYVKDVRTGRWIHEALAAATLWTKKIESSKTSNNHNNNNPSKQDPPCVSLDAGSSSRKRKRAKFAAKNARCWIYVTGLPSDCSVEELQQVFSKAGIIDLDPETQQPKIKLYRHQDGPQQGQAKGDASICFARPESVELAITLLDEAPLRPCASLPSSNNSSSFPMRVGRAKFEQHGEAFEASRKLVSNAKRQVARLAAIQAVDWDDGEVNGRISGGRKGLRIIVVKNLFDPTATDSMDDASLQILEHDLRRECIKHGQVEKITVFASNPEGVVVIKFATPGAAVDAVKAFHLLEWKSSNNNNSNAKSRTLRASFWDGVTDYTVRNTDEQKEQEMEKRHEEFGDWLENQVDELPEELRLKTANE